MFVSKKKYKALAAENAVLRKDNQKLMAENDRLRDRNIDLKFANQMLVIKLQKKEGSQFGEYFYAKEGENSDNQSK